MIYFLQVMAEKKKSYSAESISVLEGLEPVRKRPGMYIGSTGPDGLHNLVREIFDNSRDEAMGGHCDHIEITLLPDNFVRVVDNGRGIPVDKHKKSGKSALEVILTTLHAGGKFDGENYKFSGGLHGVGASVVNALSTELIATVHKDGNIYRQAYKLGKPLSGVKKLGATKLSGSIIVFQPDKSIFPEIEFNHKRLITHYREQAYLVHGTRIVLIDAREYTSKIDLSDTFYFRDKYQNIPSTSFYFEGGLVSMIKHLNEINKPIHKKVFHIEHETSDGIIVEVALQYIDDISERVLPFANNVHTPGGGMHITGFKTALTRVLNNYNKKNKIISEKEGTLSGDDVLEGLTAVVSVKMQEIQYEGQTKDKLGSPEARGAVESVFAEGFNYFLEENPDDAKAIIRKAELALRARKAAKAAKDSILRKGALEGFTLPGKLADCQTKSAEEAELFIVEGDSAGGTAKTGRDRRIQAILPLKGKPLNVEKARMDKMLLNEEIKSLVIALGSSIGETFDLEKSRYHKIIIATDADVDGAHIRTLLLTLFYRYFPKYIESGYLYIAQSPLFKIQKGKEFHYAYSDEERDKIIKSLGGEIALEEDGPTDSNDSDNLDEQTNSTEGETTTASKRVAKIHIQRYKGLGEMNADELWETTMNPDNRILKQVTVEDSVQADRTFEILMGDDILSRKSFIQSNAKFAEIDI